MRTYLIYIGLFALLFPLWAQELPSILEEHYKAAAQEKMLKVKSITTTGEIVYSMANFKSAFKIYQSRPNLLRVEGDYQGARVVQTFNGESAWNYAPSMGVPVPVELEGEELKVLLNQLQFESPLWNYEDQGAEIELVKSGDEALVQLLYTTADGDVRRFFIDRESHLISAIKSSQLLGGTETEIEVLLEDYKTVKGIPFSHRAITKMNGQVVTTLNIEKVEINRKIDPELFEKPAME